MEKSAVVTKKIKFTDIITRKNIEKKMSSRYYYGVDIGLYTVIYYQYYQMVDLLIQYCHQSIGGLNPCTLLYVLVQHHEEVKMNRKLDEKACNSILEG